MTTFTDHHLIQFFPELVHTLIALCTGLIHSFESDLEDSILVTLSTHWTLYPTKNNIIGLLICALHFVHGQPFRLRLNQERPVSSFSELAVIA